jgi:putative Mg2+ transporter-C (MgtC) family protein
VNELLLTVNPTYDVAEILEIFLDSFKIEAVFPYFLALVTATICGAAIGIERTLRQKEAGIRTHIIVAMGSALIMIVSKYGFFDIVNMEGIVGNINLDGARLAAQVVTGISFLGAGIIVYKGTVKGLTTAAGVWTTAGIGLAAGAGMYGIAVYATLIILVVQIVIHRVLPVENTSTTAISMKLVDSPEAVENISDILKGKGYEIISTSIEKKNEKLVCLFVVKSHGHINSDDIGALFTNNEYVLSVSI